jgi:hypothetical protein
MSITPSNRGDGWEFLRLGDNTIVDFRAIADDPEVRFVHTSGFLAKTRTRLPMEQAVELIAAKAGSKAKKRPAKKKAAKKKPAKKAASKAAE